MTRVTTWIKTRCRAIRLDYQYFAEFDGYPDPDWSVTIEQNEDGSTHYCELHGASRWWAYVRVFWLPTWANFAIELAKNPRCYLLDDHDWESDDYCSPDEGYMGVTCKRCGQSHGQWMY
jgi:hypothetical protein